MKLKILLTAVLLAVVLYMQFFVDFGSMMSAPMDGEGDQPAAETVSPDN